MRVEIPDCRRCCWCIPSRHGIIIYGYVTLIFTLFLLSLETWMTYRVKNDMTLTTPTMSLYKGVTFFSQMWLPVLLYVIDVVFNIILLIGAHMMLPRLIRAYYYYGITTTLAACVMLFVVKPLNFYQGWVIDVPELCLTFFVLVLQIYLLLIIRTELSKQRYQDGGLTYINHMSEVTIEPTHDSPRNPF